LFKYTLNQGSLGRRKLHNSQVTPTQSFSLYQENQSQCRTVHASRVLLHRTLRQRDNLSADTNGKYHDLVAVKHVLDYPTFCI
jgi:hypothetical protein